MQISLRDKDTRVAFFLGWAFIFSVFGFFTYFVFDIGMKGVSGLSLAYLTSEPAKSGRAGGILPVLTATLLILSVCLCVTIPLGVLTSGFLSELCGVRPRLARVVRFLMEVLAGIPSIVFGLFGNVFFCKVLGFGFSILSGGLTLACMALPIFIRTTEQGLSGIPREIRLAGQALGFSQGRVFFSVMVPCASPAIVVATILSVGRALAETAALIFTSGYVDRMPESLMDSGRALSVHIYDLSMNISGGERMAYSASLVLMALILFIHIVSGLVSRYWLNRTMAISDAMGRV